MGKKKRKTERGSSIERLQLAADLVVQGQSQRNAAKVYEVDKETLRRYINKKASGYAGAFGYAAVGEAHMIFNNTMEVDLANHIKDLANQFHGLTPDKSRELAFDFAQQNDVVMPPSWTRDRKAGKKYNANPKDDIKLHFHLNRKVTPQHIINVGECRLFYSNIMIET